MNERDLFEQAARNAGFESVFQLINHQSKPSRIVDLMENPALNTHQSIETSLIFDMLSDDIKAQVREMGSEALKVACAAYLADDLPKIVSLIPRS